MWVLGLVHLTGHFVLGRLHILSMLNIYYLGTSCSIWGDMCKWKGQDLGVMLFPWKDNKMVRRKYSLNSCSRDQLIVLCMVVRLVVQVSKVILMGKFHFLSLGWVPCTQMCLLDTPWRGNKGQHCLVLILRYWGVGKVKERNGKWEKEHWHECQFLMYFKV